MKTQGLWHKWPEITGNGSWLNGNRSDFSYTNITKTILPDNGRSVCYKILFHFSIKWQTSTCIVYRASCFCGKIISIKFLATSFTENIGTKDFSWLHKRCNSFNIANIFHLSVKHLFIVLLILFIIKMPILVETPNLFKLYWIFVLQITVLTKLHINIVM